ncbi:MAG: hypothetical protein R3E79_47335 [Caldilineaceae bacterium]
MTTKWCLPADCRSTQKPDPHPAVVQRGVSPTIASWPRELGVTRVTVQSAYDELQPAAGSKRPWAGHLCQRTPAGAAGDGDHAPHFGQQLTADAVINDLLQIHQLQAQQQHTAIRWRWLRPTRASLFRWRALPKAGPRCSRMCAPCSAMAHPKAISLRVAMTALLQKRGVTVAPEG